MMDDTDINEDDEEDLKLDEEKGKIKVTHKMIAKWKAGLEVGICCIF